MAACMYYCQPVAGCNWKALVHAASTTWQGVTLGSAPRLNISSSAVLTLRPKIGWSSQIGDGKV